MRIETITAYRVLLPFADGRYTMSKGRSADAFETTTRATAKALTPGRSSAANNLPAEIPTGTRDYYRKRYDDFVRRNPGMTPPSYYLEYGQKYCDRFSSLGPKDLSPAGLE